MAQGAKTTEGNQGHRSAGVVATGCARYVGRVGALAVVLGVGAALGSTPGTAWASPDAASDDAGPPPASAPESPGTPATGTTPTSGQNPPPSQSGAGTAVDKGKSPHTTLDVSGGANATIDGQPTDPTFDDVDNHAADDPVAKADDLGIDESQTDTEEPSPNAGSTPKAKNDDNRPQATPSPADPVTIVADAVTNVARAVLSLGAPAPAPASAPASPTHTTTAALVARTTSVTGTSSAATEPTPAPPSTGVVGIVTQLVSSVLAPFFTPGPESPAAPPVLFAILAFVRREFDSLASGFVAQTSAQTLTSQTTAPTALARTAAPVLLAAAAAPPPPAPIPVIGFVVTGVGNVVGGILGFLGGVIGGVFNAPPTARPTIDYVDDYSGNVYGQLNATDPNGDALTYAVTAQAANGVANVTEYGDFYYTPKPAARLQAAATPGPDVDKFTVTITDARGARTTVVVNNVPIVPNRAPTAGTPTVGNPDPATGAVLGTLNATDPDGDSLSYAASAPSKGNVDFGSDGSFTYRPTEQAREAAANGGVATTDSFSVVVSDGKGGSLTQTVAVRVAPYPVSGSSNAISFADQVWGETVNPRTGDLYVTTYRSNRNPAQTSTTVTVIRADGSRRIVGSIQGQGPTDHALVDPNSGIVYQTTFAPDPTTGGPKYYVTAFRPDGTTFTTSIRGGTAYLNPSSGTVHGIANSNDALDTHVVTTVRPDGTVITSPSQRGTAYSVVPNPITGLLYYTVGTRDGQTTVNAIAPDGSVTVLKTTSDTLLTFSPSVDPLTGAVYQPVVAGGDPASRQAKLLTILPNGSVRETTLPPGLITTGPRVNLANGARILPASKFEPETNQYSATVLFSIASDGSLTPLAALPGKEVGTVFTRESGGEFVFTYHPTTNITRVFAIAPDGTTTLITQADGQPQFDVKVNPVTHDAYVGTDRYNPSTGTRTRVLTVVHPNGTASTVPLYGGSDQGYYSSNLLTVNPVNGNAYEVTTTTGAVSYVTVVKPDGSVKKFTAPSNLPAEGVVVDPVSGVAYLGGNRQVILVDRAAV